MAKYCRFEKQGAAYYGELAGKTVKALSAAPWAGGEPTGESYDARTVRLLAPCQPSKIVCLARSYRDHAAELGNPLPKEPLLFLKPPSAVIGPGEEIVYPRLSQRVDAEGELALVVGRRCARPRPEADALECIFGCTCLNDVTARDLQRADGAFTRAKSFDTFCPLGPLVVTGLTAENLLVETFVNGERRQHARTSEMIFSLDVIIRSVAAVMTLEPGDVIATGTPPGVGPIRPGDLVEVAVEGIGRLRNPVVAAESA